jgi:hypothetical protein
MHKRTDMKVTPSPRSRGGASTTEGVERRRLEKQKASQSLDAELEGHAVFPRTLSVEELG